MPRKRSQPSSSQAPAAPGEFHFQPFRGLKAAPKRVAPPPPKAIVTPAAAAPVDDEALFMRAIAGAQPLSPEKRQRVAMPAPAATPRAITDPDAEAMAALCDLVTGAAPFDVSDADEYVEGAVNGLDKRLLRRLRQGEFAYQAHLDLHGLTRDEARVAVDRFLLEACQHAKRCVLIIHGRGHNSADQIPVLKRAVIGWLSRSQWSRRVLAFASARPCDGGVGALYVLLRRQGQGRQTIAVSQGSKL